MFNKRNKIYKLQKKMNKKKIQISHNMLIKITNHNNQSKKSKQKVNRISHLTIANNNINLLHLNKRVHNKNRINNKIRRKTLMITYQSCKNRLKGMIEIDIFGIYYFLL